MPNIKIETLGCKMNFCDSEKLKNKLQKIGFTVFLEKDFFNEKNKQKIDFALCNTCCVTNLAEKKSRQKIAALKNLSPQKIIITGCAVKVFAKKWQQKFPDYLILPTLKEVITFFKQEFDKNKNYNNELKFTTVNINHGKSRTRKLIPIQTGCDNFCSFCIVPLARGRSISFSKTKIIEKIKQAEKIGFKEIVLTGINLAAWGCSNSNKHQESKFAFLLEEILAKTKNLRFRISSLGSQYLNKKFFQIFAHHRICDHLHLSIQSGSKKILKKMNRGHLIDEVLFIAENAKKIRSSVALTADFIVGFPTESEEDFQQSCLLTQKLSLAKLHVFPFSKRSGTLASKMKEQISVEIKKKRAKILREIGNQLRKKFLQKNINT